MRASIWSWWRDTCVKPARRHQSAKIKNMAEERRDRERAGEKKKENNSWWWRSVCRVKAWGMWRGRASVSFSLCLCQPRSSSDRCSSKGCHGTSDCDIPLACPTGPIKKPKNTIRLLHFLFFLSLPPPFSRLNLSVFLQLCLSLPESLSSVKETLEIMFTYTLRSILWGRICVRLHY